MVISGPLRVTWNLFRLQRMSYSAAFLAMLSRMSLLRPRLVVAGEARFGGDGVFELIFVK